MFLKKIQATLSYPIIAQLFMALIFIVLIITFTIFQLTPEHDSIVWFVGWDFFYNTLTEQHVLPLWNPYDQTGTPFYPYYQPFGLLNPIQFIVVFLQKLIGWESITSYLVQFFAYYFIFIIGSYHVLRLATQNNLISFFFSIILMLACFPIFLIQNGSLHSVYLIPLISFFIMLFFNKNSKSKKGFYFFISIILISIGTLVYIPSAIIFHVIFFIIFGVLFKIFSVGNIIEFFKLKYYYRWSIPAIILGILIIAPVGQFYWQVTHDNELFPSLRVLQVTDNHLVECPTTELSGDVFLSKDNDLISLTLANLIDLVTSPITDFITAKIKQDPIFKEKILWFSTDYNPLLPEHLREETAFKRSEILLYISILPLLCILLLLFLIKNVSSYAKLFLTLTVITLLITNNMGYQAISDSTFFQKILFNFIPGMQKYHVIQNLGALFLFYIIVIAAIGYDYLVKKSSLYFVFYISIFILLIKYFIFIQNWQQGIILLHIVVQFFLLSLLLWLLITRHRPTIVITASFLVIFDMLFFTIYHSKYFYHNDRYKGVVATDFYPLYQKVKINLTEKENFINHRIPFLYPEEYYYNIFAFSAFSQQKTAFITHMRTYVEGDNVFGSPRFDHFYTTKYYYDYLVNISPLKQLFTSNVFTPILNFYKTSDVHLANSRQEALNLIQQADQNALLNQLVIQETSKKDIKQSVSIQDCIQPKNYYKKLEDEQQDLFQKMVKENEFIENKNSQFNIDIISHSVNHLHLKLNNSEDGYLYFGDGYSQYWQATVDNKAVDIKRANINFKSVYVDKGEHIVKFEYNPTYFKYAIYANIIASIVAFLFIMLFFIRSYKMDTKS